MDRELLEILVCPENRTSLRVADAALLERVNAAIAAGRMKTRGGAAVAEKLEEGLVREDGRVLYPVRDGIPVMLIDESLPLETLA